MAQTNASSPVKNIVLVHGGAFVDGSQTVRVNVRVELGIEVLEDGEPLQTDTPDVGLVLSQRTLKELLLSFSGCVLQRTSLTD